MSGDKKGKLPEGWRWEKIKDVIENNIQVFSPENYDEEKIIYIDISSVDNVSKKIFTASQMLAKEAPSRAKSILKENDIIISTVRPNLNAVALVDKSRAGNICSSGFCVIRLKNGYHPPYFFYYLTSAYFVEAVSNMVQGAMYPAISNDDVKEFPILLPPILSDQLAIAADLERRMAQVEKMRGAALRQKEAIAAMQGAVLREVFSYKEGDELPEGWRWEELVKLFTIDKQQIVPSDPSFYQLSFIGMENIESNTRKFIPNGNTEETGDSTCLLFDDRHVLYGKLRPYLNKVYLPDKKGRCSTELLPLLPKNGYSRSFIASVLQSEIVIYYAVKHSTGGRMPRADMEKLKKLKVPIPSNSNDQLAIVTKIECKMTELEKARRAAERQVEAVEALPGAILREVFDFEEENTGS